MPLTLPQRSSFLIIRDIVCRSPIGRTLWSNIRIVDWRWAISASTHRNESLIGLSKEPLSDIPKPKPRPKPRHKPFPAFE